MKQSGITPEGNPVMTDVFPLVGTHGVPLEFVLSNLHDRGIVVDWPDYIAGALKDGQRTGI